MIVKPDYFTHWKTQTLVSLAGTEEAKLWPLMLWAHCERKKSGKFLNLPRVAVGSICGTSKESEDVISALESSGFAYFDGSDFIVHEWEVYNSSLISAWDNGKKGGRPQSKLTQAEPIGNPSVTQAEPKDNPSGTDKIRVEKSSVEKKRAEVPAELSSITDFLPAWKDFQLHRKQIKKPMTVRAEEMILATLTKRPDKSLQAMNLSIRKGWQDINWGWFDNAMKNSDPEDNSEPDLHQDLPPGWVPPLEQTFQEQIEERRKLVAQRDGLF